MTLPTAIGVIRSRSGERVAGAILAFLLGATAVLALPPFSMPWILPVAFGGLFHLAAGRCRTRAFLAGWAFGAGFFLFGLSWIAESFSVDAERFGWMAVPAVAGLAAALALFPAAAMAAFASTGTNGRSGALVFAACWSGLEWLRGTVLTGLPWNLVGYAWADFDVPRQAAAWIGSYGLGLVTVFLSTLPVVIVLQAKGRGPAIFLFAVLTAGVWTVGTDRLAGRQPATDITVRIVQGNIP